jgi:hypothetical protein
MSIMLGDGTVTKATAQDISRTAVLRLDADGKIPEYFTADIYDADAGSARKKVYIGSSTAPTGMVAFANTGITLKTAVSETGAVLDSTLTIAELQAAHASATAPFLSHAGEKIFITYTVKATTKTIVISGDSFPGTYYVTGDTYSRSDVDGSDQFFQFIIPKAKMTAENTITLEAEGDPSTFSMNLTVLRPESGEMMKLVQYDLDPVNAG